MILYLGYKVARRDFLWFLRAKGPFAVLMSFLERVAVKPIVDFSGCLHFRHLLELGGAAFSISMFWTQVFPFVALQL